MKELISRVSESATAAHAHFQVWSALRGDGKALPKYFDDLNDHRYVDFFYVSGSAHYKLIFIELGCLFDSDPKSASFRALKSKLLQEGMIEDAAELEASLVEYSDLVSRIITIRSKLMAHKEVGVTSESVHEQDGGISPNQISALIAASCKAINKVTRKVCVEGSIPYVLESNRVERATLALLEVLSQRHS